MTDLVIIPLPGIGVLRLAANIYEAALTPIAAPAPSPAATAQAEPWLDSRQLAALLGVGDVTLEQMAGRGEIPSLRVGKALRFRLSEVDAALRPRDCATPSGIFGLKNQLLGSSATKRQPPKKGGFSAAVTPSKGPHYPAANPRSGGDP